MVTLGRGYSRWSFAGDNLYVEASGTRISHEAGAAALLFPHAIMIREIKRPVKTRDESIAAIDRSVAKTKTSLEGNAIRFALYPITLARCGDKIEIEVNRWAPRFLAAGKIDTGATGNISESHQNAPMTNTHGISMRIGDD